MEIFVYDTSFTLVAVIDSYESFIWTERYSDYGDFELYLPVDSDAIQYLKANYYVEIRESNRTMIIEDIQIDTDVDNGPSLKVSGRSLESILDRRIIWKQTLISNKNVDEVIKQLLYENIMSGAGANRCVEGFEYVDTDDEYIKTLGISQIQFTGDNLFDAVKGICDAFQLGFEITALESTVENGGLVRHFYFKLFAGANRSYTNDDGTEQLSNPYVVFSPNFENLLNSSYFESHQNSKTITLVAGSGEGSERVMVEVSTSNEVSKGLSRRELFTDARDLTKEVQKQDEDGNVTTVTLSDEEYNAALTERGKETLSEWQVVESFEGGVDPSTEYKYGSREDVKMGKADYSIGDILQVENEYGMENRCRVIEFIRSKDASGSETYPTFTKI